MVLPGGNGAGMAGKGRKNSVVDLLLGSLGFSGGASKSEVFSLSPDFAAFSQFSERGAGIPEFLRLEKSSGIKESKPRLIPGLSPPSCSLDTSRDGNSGISTQIQSQGFPGRTHNPPLPRRAQLGVFPQVLLLGNDFLNTKKTRNHPKKNPPGTSCEAPPPCPEST